MGKKANIVIADESALFFYEHVPSHSQLGAKPTRENPLVHCACCANELSGFNASHPLYGGSPVSVLVNSAAFRRQSRTVKSRYCSSELPVGSFYKLSDNVFLATPELVFLRMANLVSEIRLAEIGLNLCGRYYKNFDTGKIDDRVERASSVARIERYLAKVQETKGSVKARKALRWVVDNSGSPMESKMKLQFGNPLWTGGMNLPFTHMNYDVSAGRLAPLMVENEFCIDYASPELKQAMEYDGEDSHEDPSKDKRRRNALEALGWHVFPIDKAVLYNPEATMQTGMQIARHLGLRVHLPKHWKEKFRHMRRELNLPV